MNIVTTTRLIRIGNSQGVRIPKLLIDQVGLKGDVEIEVQAGQIVLRPGRTPRLGWDELYKSMAQNADDRLLDGDILPATEWEAGEWDW